MWYPADPGYNNATPFVVATSSGLRRTRRNRDIIDDSSCGRGVNLTGADGAIYTYCHFSSWSVGNGAPVAPGQIGLTGNTGNSTGPHLHFGIRTGGTRRCPQAFLLAIYDGLTPPAATSLPTTGCYYATRSAAPEPPLG
ncbi:peptidoglycan DD-metalloendopeptidase family protein [Micromonospora sp. HSS6-12]|uniref:Peptidoglycan DD-metalloendopeptidase family protein n=1 Tax=Micromonospora thermarum TaxID=2720024 RepID=A0ABX0Z8J2_9ACTN|nr:peptidoglycan DD-metalloendopeptidase family protein [Micromonospora thermarum]NJP33547.1 peptidoglycan DD-metalloendopeptidase family protein [Micromonospora thermarum]